MTEPYALFTREQQEEREFATLAPFAAFAGRSAGRVHPEDEHPFRTCFQRDRDRIIHSTAFRRLEYKTQVFINKAGDHYRTRLTHTLEVAQIARTLARILSLNEDLCETVALAHDLGHPPFGHAGERVLNGRLAGLGGFEHNRQALRVADLLEERYAGFPGLNLTAETRRGILKKKNTDLGPYPGLAERFPLEARVVDLCDKISYTTHDFDDGIASRLLDEEAVNQVGMWREAAEAVEERHPGLGRKRKRFQIIIRLINRQVGDAAETTLANLRRGVNDETAVEFGPSMREQIAEAGSFLFANLYRHAVVMRSNSRCERIVNQLFDHYVQNPGQMPRPYQARIDGEGLERTVCDYIAGMTDRYAEEDCRALFGY